MDTTGTFARIVTTEEDGTAVLTLASDKVNALDVETLTEISLRGRLPRRSSVHALVLTGQGRVFWPGSTRARVLDHGTERTGVLLEALGAVLVALFSFPKPTVAAVNGAAVAGGCILACTCDRRLLAEGARIGATELQVGVALPVFAVELLTHACGARPSS